MFASLKTFMKWIFCLVICSLIAGLIATAFLRALEWATLYRGDHPLLVYGLPLTGLLIVLFFKGRLPDIFVASTLTHLTGGSAGREGAVIQMCSIAFERMAGLFKLGERERKFFLMVAISAGFSAAIGVPLAGAIFGFEITRNRLQKNKLVDPAMKYFSWQTPLLIMACLLACKLSYFTTLLLGTVHTPYPQADNAFFEPNLLMWVAIAGVLFGFAAEIFKVLLFLVKKLRVNAIVGGVILVILFYMEGTHQYEGLGIPMIVRSFQEAFTLAVPAWKASLTALTLGSAFQGGEFTALVFVGSTLGSSLSHYIPLGVPLLAALGFVSVFAGVARVPLTCAVAAIEIFGPNIGVYALMTCMISSWMASASRLSNP